MTGSNLTQAIEAFGRAGAGIPDAALEGDWRWRDYESLRFAFLITYQELRELAVQTAVERDAGGPAITSPQRILAQHHVAYRDLRGVLSGAGDDELDRVPAEGEWPLRTVLAHIIRAEQGFFIVVRHALDAHRRGAAPPPFDRTTAERLRVQYGFDSSEGGTFAEVLSRYDAVHARVLEEFAAITEDELSAPAFFWESEPYPLRFRLHRFDAHLREHIIQAEKTLDMIDRRPREAERLMRQIWAALGEAEGAAIGAPQAGAPRRDELAAAITTRATEIVAAATV